jgi:predicted dehydrogenase
MEAIAALVRAGELGRLFAIDLVFHNAYGPDKPWFYDRAQSGGGCVMDLGIHLVDLALWTTDFPAVTHAEARLFAGGAALTGEGVEDYAVATLDLDNGPSVRLACSWRLNAGQDAVIEASFYGTEGGATLRNVGGSFYDFVAERHRGTAREVLASPPDDWGGRAAADWARRLSDGGGFDRDSTHFVAAAEALDRIYAAATRRG